MSRDNGKLRGKPVSHHRPGAGTRRGGPPGASPADRPAPRRLRRFAERIRERATIDLILAADVLYATDYWTGERCALLYGDPAREELPIDAARPWTIPAVVTFGIDRGTDDLAYLARAVELLKGSCRLVPGPRDGPEGIRLGYGPGHAEPIYSIAGPVVDECGVSYRDPATGPSPLDRREAWLAPTVVQVGVKALDAFGEAGAVRLVHAS